MMNTRRWSDLARAARPRGCRQWVSAGLSALCLGGGLAGIAHAQSSPTSAAPASSVTAPSSATLSAIGLLPVYGVSVDLDGLSAPSEVTAGLPALWDGSLRSAGFGAVHFTVDVHELGERGAIRLARLCEWAKSNNVHLAPVLAGGPTGQSLPADYAERVGPFVSKVIETLKQSSNGGLETYAQVLFYQLERPLNHEASHGAMKPGTAAELLQRAAEQVRTAEGAGLAGTSVQPTPLMITASFDRELVHNGGIAGAQLGDDVYQQSYAALRAYLDPVLAATQAEIVSVEWYPGSVSAEGTERLTDLAQRLQSDLPGRLLVLATGFSTAVLGEEAQARYCAVAIGNLADYRTSQGMDSPFAGILWRTALDGTADEPIGADALKGRDPAQSAADLARLWLDPKADVPELRHWLASVEGHFGLFSAPQGGSAAAPKAAFTLLTGLQSAAQQAATASGATEAANQLATQPAATAGSVGGFGDQIKQKLQSTFFGIVDAFLTKASTSLVSGDASQGSSDTYAGYAGSPQGPDLGGGAQGADTGGAQDADVQIAGLGAAPTGLAVNEEASLGVTVYNAGDAPASNTTVYLVDGEGYALAQSSPMTLEPGASSTLAVAWTPAVAGTYAGVKAQVYCDNESHVADNESLLGDLQVGKGGTSGGGGTGTLLSLSPAVLASLGSSAKKTQPGFVNIEALQFLAGGMKPMSAQMPPGTGPKQPAPISITLVNPFDRPATHLQMTLRVDGGTIAARDVGSLLPRQRRTIVFTEWKPKKSGAHAVSVNLQGVGLSHRAMSASANTQVMVPAAGPGPTAQSARTASSLSADAHAGVPPAKSLTRALSPLLRSRARPVAQSRATGSATRGATRQLVVTPPLRLTANSIVLEPFPIRAGGMAVISVRLFNPERETARRAEVHVFADGEPLGEARLDVPAASPAVAAGFKRWTPKPGRHVVSATVTLGGRTASAAKPIEVTASARPTPRTAAILRRSSDGPATFALVPAATSAPAAGPSREVVAAARPETATPGRTGLAPELPDLQLGPTDLRVTPSAPRPGDALVLVVGVHNLASVGVRDGMLECVLVADGREVARRRFTVAAGPRGMATLQWPLVCPDARQLVINALASVAGDPRPENNRATTSVAVTLPMRAAPKTRR